VSLRRTLRRLRCLLRGGHRWFVAARGATALVACSRCLHGWDGLPVLPTCPAPVDLLRAALPASDDLDLTLRLVEAATGGHPDVRRLLEEASRRPIVTWRLASMVARGGTDAERLRDVQALSLYAQLVALQGEKW